jgi:hypothetical protein
MRRALVITSHVLGQILRRGSALVFLLLLSPAVALAQSPWAGSWLPRVACRASDRNRDGCVATTVCHRATGSGRLSSVTRDQCGR